MATCPTLLYGFWTIGKFFFNCAFSFASFPSRRCRRLSVFGSLFVVVLLSLLLLWVFLWSFFWCFFCCCCFCLLFALFLFCLCCSCHCCYGFCSYLFHVSPLVASPGSCWVGFVLVAVSLPPRPLLWGHSPLSSLLLWLLSPSLPLVVVVPLTPFFPLVVAPAPPTVVAPPSPVLLFLLLSPVLCCSPLPSPLPPLFLFSSPFLLLPFSPPPTLSCCWPRPFEVLCCSLCCSCCFCFFFFAFFSPIFRFYVSFLQVFFCSMFSVILAFVLCFPFFRGSFILWNCFFPFFWLMEKMCKFIHENDKITRPSHVWNEMDKFMCGQ